MTGRPAETWRKFTFRTPPTWTYALLLLICLGLIGIIAFAIIVGAVSRKATGHLPLTRSSRTVANVMTWLPAGLILASFAAMTLVVGAALANVDSADANAASLGGVVFLVSIFVLTLGLVGRLALAPLVLPRAKVEQLAGYDDLLVDMRNVHPNFVAAVMQQHQAFVAQPEVLK